MAEKIVLAELDYDIGGIEKSNATLIKQIAELKDKQKELKSETDNLTNASADQADTYIKNDAALKNLNKEYNTNKTVLAEVTTGVNGLNSALEKEVQTEAQAKKNNSELTKARSQVNAKTKEGKAAIEQINTKIDQNNKFIKQNTSQLEKQRLNIGNYSSAIDRVIPGLGTWIQKGYESQTMMKGQVSGLSKVRVALISTGIGAIVVLLGSLIAAWSSTQQGMDKINTVMRPVNAGFKLLLGILQDLSFKVFAKLKEAIDNPVESLKQLGQVIVDNVINRFKAFVVFGNAVSQLMSGDFKQAAKTAADAFIQFNTGIEGATDKLANAKDSIGGFIDEAIRAGSELDSLTKGIEEKEIELTKKRGQLNRQYEQSKELLNDQNLSFEERERAAQKALAAQNELEKLGLEFADMKIKRKKLENSLNDTSRKDLLELAQLEAEREQFAANAAKKRTSVASQQRSLQKQIATEQVANVKQALDKEIELQQANIEKQKLLNQEFQQAKDLAQLIKFEEELNALEEQGESRLAIRMAEIAQDQELAILEAERKIENKTLLEAELALIEKDFAKQRLAVKEEEEISKLQLVSNVNSEIIGIFGQQSEIGKLAGATNATISTIVAATKALETGPILGPILATLISAKGALNVQRILSTPTPKFTPKKASSPRRAEQGALIELNGPRHTSGGMDIYDAFGNPLVNAEGGEILGVMNRNAARMFMEFNDAHKDGSYANPFESNNKGGLTQAINEDSLASKITNPIASEIRRKKMGGVIISDDGIEAFETDGRNRSIYLNQRFLN